MYIYLHLFVRGHVHVCSEGRARRTDRHDAITDRHGSIANKLLGFRKCTKTRVNGDFRIFI